MIEPVMSGNPIEADQVAGILQSAQFSDSTSTFKGADPTGLTGYDPVVLPRCGE